MKYFCNIDWLEAVNLGRADSHFVQTAFVSRRNISGTFRPNGRKQVILAQNFWQFPAWASNDTSYKMLQQKVFCNQVFPVLRLGDTVALYPHRSEHFQERTRLFGQKFKLFSQNFSLS